MSNLSIRQPNPRIVTMVITGICLLLAAWSVQWFLKNYEKRYEETRSDVSPKARKNPLLAAERFLTGIGVTAQSVSGRNYLSSPPPQSGMLVVNRLGRDLLPDQQQQLVDWIKDGGHLVLVPNHAWHDHADENEELDEQSVSLLNQFSIHLRSLSNDCGYGEDPKALCEEEIIALIDGNYANPIEVRFKRHTILEDLEQRADWSLEGEKGAHLLHFELGEGWLTVLSDNQMLRNENIGDLDHALFLALLNGNAQHAWMLYSSNMPSLFQLIWKNLPQLLIISFISLMLWLFFLTTNTGPRFPPPERARRNLLEHLHAAANHAWASNHAQGMLASSSLAIDQQWQRRHPALEHMDDEKRVQWIAKQTGLTQSAVQMALTGKPASVSDFIRMTSIQQKLVKAVAGSKTDKGSVHDMPR